MVHLWTSKRAGITFCVLAFNVLTAAWNHDENSISLSGRYQQVMSQYYAGNLMGQPISRVLQDLAENNSAPLRDIFRYASMLIGGQGRKADDCLRDMMIINHAATKLGADWAKQFLDSNGAKAPGMLSGNMRWLGDFDQCRSIKTVELEDDITISPQYCRIALGAGPSNGTAGIPFLGFTLGVCVSRSCQIKDLQPLIAMIPELASFKPRVDMKTSHCIEDDLPFSTISIVTIALFSAVGCLMLIGLAIDCSMQLHSWLKNWENEKETAKLPTLPQKSVKDAKTPDEHGPFVELLLSFSPYTNFLKMFSVQSSDSTGNIPNLNAINGIRALSVFWVILGHSYLFMNSIVDNLKVAFGEMPKRISFQFVFAGFYAVDTFLFLSGFLAYWSMVKQIKARPVCNFFKTLFFIYVHRYLRLTVAVGALMLINLGLYQHFSVGPNYRQVDDENCVENWWTNLLYVNNFVHSNKQCVGWVWYLAVDMQLFILTPFVVYLFVWKGLFGWLASILALSTQIACSMALTYIYKMPSTSWRPAVMHSGDDRDYGHYFDYVYIKPYTRVGPYAIGVICAHLAFRHGRGLCRNIFSRFWLSALMWLLMFGTMLSLIYAQYGIYAGDYVQPRIIDAISNALTRMAWGIALAWLILACIFNHAGVVGRILCWPVWAIPARLGYAAYLLHPVVMNFYADTSRRTFNVTDITMIFMYVAIIITTLIVSVPFSLAFESPVIGLLRLLLPNKSKKPSKN